MGELLACILGYLLFSLFSLFLADTTEHDMKIAIICVYFKTGWTSWNYPELYVLA